MIATLDVNGFEPVEPLEAEAPADIHRGLLELAVQTARPEDLPGALRNLSDHLEAERAKALRQIAATRQRFSIDRALDLLAARRIERRLRRSM